MAFITSAAFRRLLELSRHRERLIEWSPQLRCGDRRRQSAQIARQAVVDGGAGEGGVPDRDAKLMQIRDPPAHEPGA